MTRAVFALTSQGNDLFSSLTRLAVASLRVSNPDMRVTIVCDQQSDSTMRQTRDALIGEIDDWQTIATPAGNAGFRNRFVKTSLRSLLEGPFLFLDSDIFVRGDLSEIFALDCDIAGARNHSREVFSEQVWEQDWSTLKKMEWDIGNEVYINGGVLFFNDTESAHRLAQDWHRRWMVSYKTHGSHRDQPALNASLYSVLPQLAVLPDRFNAQIFITPNVAVDASIWHYYSSVGRLSMTSFDALVGQMLQGAEIDTSAIRQLIERRHPWRYENIIDAWVARWMMRHGSYNGLCSTWLKREWISCLRRRVKRR